jgi:thiamine biosynthesis lipoprotein
MMGTIVEIKAYGENARSAAKNALNEMEKISNQISVFDSESEVSFINSMAGIAKVAVSPRTFDIISRSIKLSKSLGRSFDITIGPLINLWDFNKKEDFMPPSPQEIREALKLVNFYRIEIDPQLETVKLLKRGMKINLGGVAKGYTLSVARNLMVSEGIRSALISTGSSITCIGSRPDGKPWRVGIRSSRGAENVIGTIELVPGQALSTSGDYEQYIEYEGKRYHHLIDPRTGYPASGCQSVTVLAGDATAADMISTAVFVMGPWKGLRFLKSLENVEGLIVDSNGKIHKTDGFKLEPVENEAEK